MTSKRAAELEETKRMEEMEMRRENEKKERIEQERVRQEKERQVKERDAARSFAQQFLNSLTPKVFTNLQQKGFFYDPVKREVETKFVPSLMQQMDFKLKKNETSHAILEALIADALQKSLDVHRTFLVKQKQEVEEKEAILRHQQAEKERIAKEAADKKKEEEKKEDDSEDDSEDDE
jgi:hypothetical protein